MDEKHFKNILTRQLPKTGQTIEYQVGDDGTHQAGWWKGRLNANNRTRFIAKTIGGDDIAIDRATGLVWPADWGDINFGLGNNGSHDNLFNVWLPAMNAANYGGFSDWRIPNAFELMSLVKFGGAGFWIDTNIFSNVAPDPYWTSTTDKDYPTFAFCVHFNYFTCASSLKTNLNYRIAVRGGL